MNLLKNAEFSPLIEYWKATRSEALDRLVLVKDHQTVLQLQGEIRILNTLIKDIENSTSLMNTIR